MVKWWLVVLIIVVYFAFRLPNLTVQPIFADEAIYIRWAQVMKAEPTLRFISLQDGKTPLFMWLMIPLFKIFSNPLFAGRILSVIAGFLTMLGVLFLGWRFFSYRVGLVAALLLSISPYIIFFDRLSLVDSMLSAFSIWSLNLSLLLLKQSRIDLAMVLGYLFGGGLLTKTPGMFNLLVLPTTLVAYNFKQRKTQLWRLVSLWFIALIIGFGIYNLLRLGPGFVNLSARNQDYIFSPLDLIGRPLDPLIPHFKDMADWYPKLLGHIVLVFWLAGIIVVIKNKNRIGLAILFWSLIPLLILSGLLKTFTARYVLFTLPPLLVITAIGTTILGYFKAKKVVCLILTLTLLPIINTDFLLLTHPEQANLPKNERRGYFEDWTAGIGLVEISQFLIDQARSGSVVVGTGGNFGTLPDGLAIYLEKYNHQVPESKRVVVIGGTATISAQLKQAALTHPTLFVISRSQFSTKLEDVSLLKEYLKPASPGNDHPQDAMQLYQVIP